LKHTASVAPGGGCVSTANMRVRFGSLAHLVQLAVMGWTGVGATNQGMARGVPIVDDHPDFRTARDRHAGPSRRAARHADRSASRHCPGPTARSLETACKNTAAALSLGATLETRRLTSDSGARPSPDTLPAPRRPEPLRVAAARTGRHVLVDNSRTALVARTAPRVAHIPTGATTVPSRHYGPLNALGDWCRTDVVGGRNALSLGGALAVG